MLVSYKIIERQTWHYFARKWWGYVREYHVVLIINGKQCRRTDEIAELLKIPVEIINGIAYETLKEVQDGKMYNTFAGCYGDGVWLIICCNCPEIAKKFAKLFVNKLLELER